MAIHKQQTEHGFATTGPAMTEPEHAERCSIEYQLERMSKGLPPNWNNPMPLKWGYEKMDNSLTDHRIDLKNAYDEVMKLDLAEITDDQWESFSPEIKQLIKNKVYADRDVKKAKDDEKQKNDDNELKRLKTAAEAFKNLPSPTPQKDEKSS